MSELLLRGRPQSTGFKDANNFRAKLLNPYQIPYKRVYGTDWFLIVMPSQQSLLYKLKPYLIKSIKEVSEFENIEQFTHIVFVDRVIPDDPDYIYDHLCYTMTPNVKAPPSRGRVYKTHKCPLWTNQAISFLKAYNIEYTQIDRGVCTQREIMEHNGLKYDPDTSLFADESTITGWRLIKIVNSPREIKYNIRVDDYVLLRDYMQVGKMVQATMVEKTDHILLRAHLALMYIAFKGLKTHPGMSGEHVFVDAETGRKAKKAITYLIKKEYGPFVTRKGESVVVDQIVEQVEEYQLTYCIYQLTQSYPTDDTTKVVIDNLKMVYPFS